MLPVETFAHGLETAGETKVAGIARAAKAAEFDLPFPQLEQTCLPDLALLRRSASGGLGRPTVEIGAVHRLDFLAVIRLRLGCELHHGGDLVGGIGLHRLLEHCPHGTRQLRLPDLEVRHRVLVNRQIEHERRRRQSLDVLGHRNRFLVRLGALLGSKHGRTHSEKRKPESGTREKTHSGKLLNQARKRHPVAKIRAMAKMHSARNTSAMMSEIAIGKSADP